MSKGSFLNYYLYLFASLIVLILGLGHLVIELLSWYFLGPPDPVPFTAMVNYKVHIFGFTRSLNDFMRGFSITMGTFMVAFGALNLLLLKNKGEVLIRIPYLSLMSSLVCLIVCILSILFFHWPPIIFFFISFVLYLVVYFRVFALK